MLSVFPKAIKQIKNNRLKLIQKHIRGYLAYNIYQKKLAKMKLKQLEMFDRIKKKLYEDSQIKIRYYWKLKKRRMQVKLLKKRQQAKVTSQINKGKTEVSFNLLHGLS